jgi:hypothetical protein
MVENGFEEDRQDYWAMRDELLAKYPGKWVAVHKGRVVAVADEPLSIMEQALVEDGYAYTNKVGDEDKIVIRQRPCVTFRIVQQLANALRLTFANPAASH